MGALLVVMTLAGCALVLLTAPRQWKKALAAHNSLVGYLAESLHLEALPIKDDFGAHLTGRVGDLDLTVEAHANPLHFGQTIPGRGRPQVGGVAYVVDGAGAISPRVAMRRAETTSDDDEKDLRIGDPEFDRHVALYGHEFHALALLDPSTRSRVVHLVRDHGVVLQDGRVSHFEALGLDDAARLTKLIGGLIDFGRRMRLEDKQIPVRLAVNLALEPVPEVRRKLARALFGGFPDHPAADQARRGYEGDADPVVAFYAQVSDPIEGRARLEAAIGDTKVSLELRAFAARRLGQEMILWLLPEMEPFPRILRRSIDELREHGSAKAEPALIHALVHPSRSVRASAALALGRIGTLAAVPPLATLRDTLPLLLEGELKRTASKAIAQIQARLGHPADGALSIATGDEERGALSPLSAEAGAVSDPPIMELGPESTEAERVD